jgi:hypothetical protein
MSSGMGLNRKPTELGYNENNEEILGYLAHGLAQWQE